MEKYSLSAQLYGSGDVAKIEAMFSTQSQQPYSLSVSSATAGILSVFYALEIRNKEVIVPPITWPGVFGVFDLLNIRPRFADILEDYSLDVKCVRKLVNKQTSAIFTCDLFGYPNDLVSLKELADQEGIWLINDACHSLGSIYLGFQSGYFADVNIFSMGAIKDLVAGEGGVVCTADEAIYEKLLFHSAHPNRQNRELQVHNPLAINTRINPLAASHAVVHFEDSLANIKDRKSAYKTYLSEYGLGQEREGREPNYYRCLLPKRDARKLDFKKLCHCPYDIVFNNRAFKKRFGKSREVCPVAEKIIRESVIFNLNSSLCQK